MRHWTTAISRSPLKSRGSHQFRLMKFALEISEIELAFVCVLIVTLVYMYQNRNNIRDIRVGMQMSGRGSGPRRGGGSASNASQNAG